MRCLDSCTCILCRELRSVPAKTLRKCKSLSRLDTKSEQNFILREPQHMYKSVVIVPGPPPLPSRPSGASGANSKELVTYTKSSPVSADSNHSSSQPNSPIRLSGSSLSVAQGQTPCGQSKTAESPRSDDERTKRDVTISPQHTPPHHHTPTNQQLRFLQRRNEGGSSSDDQRGTSGTSGHASMSDGHISSSPTTDIRHHHYTPNSTPPLYSALPDSERVSSNNGARSARKSVQSRSRHRATPAKLVGCSGSGIEEIKLAIQQLTMRSHTSNSTSTYSSLSGSEGSERASRRSDVTDTASRRETAELRPTDMDHPVRRLVRHSSLETINTNVTAAADEFVWVDSHNRLVELGRLPWSNHDVLKVLQGGRVRSSMEFIAMETVPRLSYLLQRALVRIAREAQRLARALGLCGKQEIASSLRIVLSPNLADSCIKACLRSGAMYAVSGDQLKQSKSQRAGLHLSVGRFHRWMVDVRLGKFVHEYAAVYLTAGLENLLEEIILQCLPSKPESVLTASMFEHSIANNSELWGLLQPYAHLNTGRTASGSLSVPRWASVSSVQSSGGEGGVSSGCGSPGGVKRDLLTTCVASVSELSDLLRSSVHVLSTRPHFSHQAIQALFYFMRCSQLEHCGSVQELVYERAYCVLPPLVEWLRVSSSHAHYRHSSTVDADDIMQAARLLLPGVDCPIRQPGAEECIGPARNNSSSSETELDNVKKLKTSVAFKMLLSASREIVPHALQLLPSTKLNTVCDSGLSPLMLACINNDEQGVRVLLEFGCDPDLETPPQGSQGCPTVQGENQHWTALTYTALQGNITIAKLLLERGAHVEGGARHSDDRCTLSPLQVASGSGNIEMVSLLLSHGAHPFLSTLCKDPMSYSGNAQRGSYSSFAVAAAHGQRSVLHKLLSHPLNSTSKQVLSLEEILAEGTTHLTTDRRHRQGGEGGGAGQLMKLTKSQIKCLQEAMYQSTENNHLEMTLDLRNLGVGWGLHCWMSTLAEAYSSRMEAMIDHLLQDFLHVWPDDCSVQFVDECLPLLFNIFRYTKNEGTTLLLADIFSTCYGWEQIRPIRDSTLNGGARIDPKFVNNPELSDVQFRVEGRVFYAHKIVLVTSSPRFRGMLSSKLCEGNPPIVQINDIRYHIFQLVMEYLYNGGCEGLEVDQNDVLELMAAANFFQLDGLMRFCEAQSSALTDLDNIVSMYIHAKVYNACQLLEYCQGFLLQNMMALLTYDDSVKRLLFGKKLHNHDVLAGLLLTLQARIKSRNHTRQHTATPKPKPKS